mmetsp:Transcript_7153/g.17784  ORF Transcript_7153/g.17784 Transcript_7153/m.17784 type:complete len:200 (-) Transcript_7153:1519-2118(-)
MLLPTTTRMQTRTTTITQTTPTTTTPTTIMGGTNRGTTSTTNTRTGPMITLWPTANGKTNSDSTPPCSPCLTIAVRPFVNSTTRLPPQKKLPRSLPRSISLSSASVPSKPAWVGRWRKLTVAVRISARKFSRIWVIMDTKLEMMTRVAVKRPARPSVIFGNSSMDCTAGDKVNLTEPNASFRTRTTMAPTHTATIASAK